MQILSSFKKIEKLVQILLIGVVLIIIPNIFLNFEIAKIVFARSIILILFLIIGLNLIRKKIIYIPSILKDKNIVKCIILLFLSLIISILSSVAPQLSFFGSYFRMQGVYSFLHYILLFILLLFSFQKDLQWKKINKIIVFIFVFLIILSILQFLGVDFLNYREFQNHGNRISASFSNPNFFGGLIVLLFFPVFNLIKNSLCKILIILSSLFVLILTGSKGALLAFIIGLFLYSFLNIVYLNEKKYLSYFALIITILLFVLFYASKFDFLYRFQISEENLVSTNTRIQIWEDSLQMIDDSPFIGYGIETFPIVFHKYANLEELKRDNLFGLIDKPHNIILDILYSVGFLGLLVYLFIINTILKKCFEALKKVNKDKKQEILAIISGLSALFFSNLFSFSVTVHFIFISFYLAHLFYLISLKTSKIKISLKKRTREILEIILIFFVTANLIIYNIFYVFSDYYLKKGLDSFNNQTETNTILENFQLANFYNQKN